MKILYTFKLKKPSNGEEIELAIRKPTRSETDEADMLVSVFQSECIRRGVLTKEMMLKAYKNFGGAMSETEAKKYRKLSDNYAEVVFKMQKTQNKKELAKLQKQYDIIWAALSEINNEHEHLFNRTADVIARNKVILHLVLLLGLQKKDDQWVSVFQGVDFEDRYESFAAYEEIEPDDAEAILGKISSFVTFWYYGDKSLTENDFKECERLIYGEEEQPIPVETESNPEG